MLPEAIRVKVREQEWIPTELCVLSVVHFFTETDFLLYTDSFPFGGLVVSGLLGPLSSSEEPYRTLCDLGRTSRCVSVCVCILFVVGCFPYPTTSLDVRNFTGLLTVYHHPRSSHSRSSDLSFHQSLTDKIRQYRVDYNNRPSTSNVISFVTVITSMSECLHCEFDKLYRGGVITSQ
jgi:hypothetical protein